MNLRANVCRGAAVAAAAVTSLLVGCYSANALSEVAEIEPVSAQLGVPAEPKVAAEMSSPHLVTVTISPEARVKAAAGEAPRLLRQGEWSEFSLVIENAAGITAPLMIESEQIMTGAGDGARDRWLRVETLPAGPLTGSDTETRRLRLFSRDAGIRTAVLSFNAGQGTQDLGFRGEVVLTFKVAAAVPANADRPGPHNDGDGPGPVRPPSGR